MGATKTSVRECVPVERSQRPRASPRTPWPQLPRLRQAARHAAREAAAELGEGLPAQKRWRSPKGSGFGEKNHLLKSKSPRSAGFVVRVRLHLLHAQRTPLHDHPVDRLDRPVRILHVLVADEAVASAQARVAVRRDLRVHDVAVRPGNLLRPARQSSTAKARSAE